MKRKQFLRGIGLASIGVLAKPQNILSEGGPETGPCVLIPTETAGPFPLDLSENAFYLRQNVIEDRIGTPLKLKMKIIGLNNCLPMANVRVNIWHCDKDGNYSGYSTQTGKTFLRGYQFTDAYGMVEFDTVFPGWYNGRVCHIHFQVFVSQTYAAVSQLTFEHAKVNTLYSENTQAYSKGPDPKTPDTDNIFNDGYKEQIASLAPNQQGGYESYLEVTVKGDGLLGVSNYEIEASKIVELHQNYPNPFAGITEIPFNLKENAETTLELYNVQGQKVYEKSLGYLNAGKHQITINTQSLLLEKGNYIYQLTVSNSQGTFKLAKLMTW